MSWTNDSKGWGTNDDAIWERQQREAKARIDEIQKQLDAEAEKKARIDWYHNRDSGPGYAGVIANNNTDIIKRLNQYRRYARAHQAARKKYSVPSLYFGVRDNAFNELISQFEEEQRNPYLIRPHGTGQKMITDLLDWDKHFSIMEESSGMSLEAIIKQLEKLAGGGK